MSNLRPSELELQVLSLLWDQGPKTVRQIRDDMPDQKKRAYTTMLSVLQQMEKKKLVDHERQGVAHVYRPLVKRNQVLKPLFKDLLRNVFRGKTSNALQCLLDSSEIDAEELSEIQDIIDQHAAKETPTQEKRK